MKTPSGALLGTALLFFTVGCYNPTFGEQGGFTCSERSPACPEGYTCDTAAGYCQKNGSLRDAGTTPDGSPAPDALVPGEWFCNVVGESQLGTGVSADVVGLSLNPISLNPWLAFHEAGGTSNLKIYERIGSESWVLQKERLARGGAHAAILSHNTDTIVAYNGQIDAGGSTTQAFAVAANSAILPTALTSGPYDRVGRYPSLIPLGADGGMLVTHMFSFQDATGASFPPLLESYLLRPQRQPELVDVPLLDPFVGAGLHARAVVLPGGGGVMAFWALRDDGRGELAIAYPPSGTTSAGASWSVEVVSGTQTFFDPGDPLQGIGIAHNSAGVQIAFPLFEGDGPTRLFLSSDGRSGEEIKVAGQSLEGHGNPALASSELSDALGLLAVNAEQGLVFTFRPPQAREWIAVTGLARPLRRGARAELIALRPEIFDQPAPEALPMHFLAAYPSADNNVQQVALVEIECAPFLATR